MQIKLVGSQTGKGQRAALYLLKRPCSEAWRMINKGVVYDIDMTQHRFYAIKLIQISHKHTQKEGITSRVTLPQKCVSLP